MSDTQELADVARAIIDANSYMTIGSADENGLPWVSPVWFAPADHREFFWVSDPDATHSRNIAARPQVSIVIFDSRVPIGTGQAAYIAATAEQLAGRGARAGHRGLLAPLGGALSTPVDRGGHTRSRGASPLRATASGHWVLDPDSPTDRRAR